MRLEKLIAEADAKRAYEEVMTNIELTTRCNKNESRIAFARDRIELLEADIEEQEQDRVDKLIHSINNIGG